MTEDEAMRAARKWVVQVYDACGIKHVTFGDGSLGLLGVTPRCVQALDAMHAAIFGLLCGDAELPKIAPPPPPKKPRRKP
jgi:hypothetical protein